MDINNFRVSPDGKFLELWVEIPEGPGYSGLTIDKIAIQDHMHYTIGYPSNPQIELTATQEEPFDIGDNKRVIKILSFSDMKILGNLDNTGLFFMYVHQVGVPGPELECKCSLETTIAVAVNMFPIYNKAIKLINQLNGECTDKAIRDELVDLHWKKDTFRQAVMLQEYDSAISLFNDTLFSDIKEGNCFNTCSNSNYNELSYVVPTSGGCKTCG